MPDDQNGPNQYADMGLGTDGSTVPPMLDTGDLYDMPNDFNQQGVRVSGVGGGANTTGAKSTQRAMYDEASPTGQTPYSLAQQNNPAAAQQQPFYDEASPTGQADYDLAQNTGQLYYDEADNDDIEL